MRWSGSAGYVAAVLVGMPPSASAAQTPAPPPPPPPPPRFDGRRLAQRTDTFATYFIRGSDTVRSGTVIVTIRSDGTLLTRTHDDEESFAPQHDTIVDRVDSFLPVAHRSHTASGTGVLRFERGAATGWQRLVNGDSMAVNMPFPAGVYNAASFDLIVRASDLREGLQLDLRGFRLGDNVVVTLRGRVTGTEVVDGRPCWVFRGSNGMLPVTFWVDQETRALRRQLLQFQTASFHLMTSAPRVETLVTDAEKRGIIVGVTMLRHPDFGFVVPLPGPHFALDTVLQAQMNTSFGSRPDLFVWALRDPAHVTAALTIHVYKGFDGTEAGLRRFPREVLKADFSAKTWEVFQDSVYWEAQRREYRMSVRDRGGVYMRARCIPSPPEQTPPLIVCVMTVGMRSDVLETVPDGLRFARSPQ